MRMPMEEPRFIVNFNGIKSPPRAESAIVQDCLTGLLAETAECAPHKTFLVSYSWRPIREYPRFAQALDERPAIIKAEQIAREVEQNRAAEEAAIAEAKARKEKAQCDPAPHILLTLRDNGVTGKKYTAAQLRHMFSRGAITAEAEFQHPDYEDWFPCHGLLVEPEASVSSTAQDRWEYHALSIEISGTTLGVLSVFTEKEVKSDSACRIAELGAQGWELVSVIPVTAGAVGSSWSNAGIAFFKRRLS